ncbi:MAG: polyamine aminopropyltransferase, partial [Candidatus Margulisiibacteriota bacterium]
MTSPLWFTEDFEPKKGRRVQVAYDAVLESRQSSFQKIEVFQTIPYGKMLVLDGVIMLTEFDHFAYHEMMAHVPLNA